MMTRCDELRPDGGSRRSTTARRLLTLLFCCTLSAITGGAHAQTVLPGPGIINTVAGNGTAGFSGDGGQATSPTAEIYEPWGLTVDSVGNIYIADLINQRIRKVTASTGIITTVAGGASKVCTAHTDSMGDGCPATEATLNYPYSVAVDAAGDIYIADLSNERIRKVTASTGIITTVAGGGTPCAGKKDSVGDGCLATDATLSDPWAVALDYNGNIYIADANNSRIRVVNTGASATTIATVVIQPGYIATVAGNGSVGHSGDGGPALSAELNSPMGLAVDYAGNIYIADAGNEVIRKVTTATGDISRVAGEDNTHGYNGDDILATSAELFDPYGVAVDYAGNIYIADETNERVRVVNVGSAQTTIATVEIPAGDIATLAGDGNVCSVSPCGDGGSATSAELDGPPAVAIDSLGNIYISDQSNNRIRAVGSSLTQVTLTGGTITGSDSGLSLSGTEITQYNSIVGGLGTVSFSTGALASGNLTTGGTFGAGGSVTVTTNGTNGTYNGVDFSGTFSGAVTWTEITTSGPNGSIYYTLSGPISNSAGEAGILTIPYANAGKNGFTGSVPISGGTVTF
jgi:hypothetical protein